MIIEPLYSQARGEYVKCIVAVKAPVRKINCSTRPCYRGANETVVSVIPELIANTRL